MGLCNVDIVSIILQPIEKCITCGIEVPIEQLVEHLKQCGSR